MFWFCWHSWGDIKDNYQYCTKCNLAIVAPCNHEYDTTHESKITRMGLPSSSIGMMFIQKCKHCGNIKKTICNIY